MANYRFYETLFSQNMKKVLDYYTLTQPDKVKVTCFVLFFNIKWINDRMDGWMDV